MSTATFLLQHMKGIKVYLVANHFPGDISGEYTSPLYRSMCFELYGLIKVINMEKYFY
ncbi:MAG TPA: hypothetical protein VJ697_09150 [Nitrososphaeraceae archaeon]|nr:hypothetical protein [Nitrososphaeraceae archaeon]